MISLFWASVIMAPVAFVIFVPFSTYIYIAVTAVTPRYHWVRALAGNSEGRIEPSRGATLMALFFAALSQVAALSLVMDGFGPDPFADLALACGSLEWLSALAWLAFLRATSRSAQP